MKPPKSNVLKILQKVTRAHNMYDVLHDFVIMGMAAIHNSIIASFDTGLENKYNALAEKYTTEERQILSDAMGELIEEFKAIVNGEKGFHDVLGDIYMESATANKETGQCFTPYCISQAMAATVINEDHVRECIGDDGQGVMTLLEPTCGAGAMILACAERLKNMGVNYAWNLCAIANDIDERCVAMTYLQCALAGIPAIITHGNGLTNEYWARYETPAYLMGYVHFKNQLEKNHEQRKIDRKDVACNKPDAAPVTANVHHAKELDGQLDLFG